MSIQEEFRSACESGDVKAVTSLLSSNLSSIDINSSSHYSLDAIASRGWTPLHHACKNCHVEIVRILIALPLIDVNKSDIYGCTPLYVACSNGRTKVVEVLLKDHRVLVNQSMNGGSTPLFIACRWGYTEVVKVLVKDPRVLVNESSNGWTPLFVACCCGEELSVKQLLASGRVIDATKRSNPGTDDYSDKSPAEIAYNNGYESIGIMVDDYVSNPMHIIQTLRNELNWTTLECDILAMMIFVCDGLLQVKPSSPEEVTLSESNDKRFFGISSRLPFELQMGIANRCNGLSANLIPFQDRERGFQSLALIFKLMD